MINVEEFLELAAFDNPTPIHLYDEDVNLDIDTTTGRYIHELSDEWLLKPIVYFYVNEYGDICLKVGRS